MEGLLLCGSAVRREIPQGLQPGQKEIGAAFHAGESRQSLDRLSNRAPGNLELERPVVIADDGIALVAELVKIRIVRPDVLRELELTDEARADHEGRDAA